MKDRLDRIEKAIEQHTRQLELQLQLMAQSAAHTDSRLDRADARLERIDARLDRAIRLSIEEFRNERRRRREADERIDGLLAELAAAQRITEEGLRALQQELQTFIRSLHKGGNGTNGTQ